LTINTFWNTYSIEVTESAKNDDTNDGPKKEPRNPSNPAGENTNDPPDDFNAI